MAFPTTVPAFERGNDASQWVVYFASTTTTPLGQVKMLDWTTAKEREEARRISDSKKYRTTVGIDVTGTLELWQDTDNAEVEMLTGAAGMTANDATKSFIAEFYSGTATDSTVAATYTFANFDVESETGGPREAGSQTYWTYSFSADSCTRS